ncbi:TPA: ogr/Delta-like zinc finger family protein [Mannheimia haemolytica]
MFKVLIECPNCGQHQFYVRSSEKMTRLTRSSSCICRNCNAKLRVQTEVVKVELPNYVDTPEALRANKPYNQIDPNQADLPLND